MKFKTYLLPILLLAGSSAIVRASSPAPHRPDSCSCAIMQKSLLEGIDETMASPEMTPRQKLDALEGLELLLEESHRAAVQARAETARAEVRAQLDRQPKTPVVLEKFEVWQKRSPSRLSVSPTAPVSAAAAFPAPSPETAASPTRFSGPSAIDDMIGSWLVASAASIRSASALGSSSHVSSSAAARASSATAALPAPSPETAASPVNLGSAVPSRTGISAPSTVERVFLTKFRE